MSGSGRVGNGRGNNHRSGGSRRPFRRRDKDNENWQGGEAQDVAPENHGRRGGSYKKSGEKASFVERPKWVPPKMNTEPLPVPDCPFCGKPIRDISAAIADKDTGIPVHFDCVTSRITENERLEKGDSVSYIGGGRFGIVNFGNSLARDPQGRAGSPAGPLPGINDFKIKKVIEWENKDKRANWRSLISDHYSVT